MASKASFNSPHFQWFQQFGESAFRSKLTPASVTQRVLTRFCHGPVVARIACTSATTFAYLRAAANSSFRSQILSGPRGNHPGLLWIAETFLRTLWFSPFTEFFT